MLRSVNQATKGVLGRSFTSSGVPSCWILPLHIQAALSVPRCRKCSAVSEFQA